MNWNALALMLVLGPLPAGAAEFAGGTRHSSHHPAHWRQSFANSVGMKFALIPAAEFVMGSPDSERTK